MEVTKIDIRMDVFKNKDTPKWMVYNGLENLIKMDDLGGTIIFGNTHIGSPPNLHPLSTKGWFFIEFFNRSERRQPEAPMNFLAIQATITWRGSIPTYCSDI